MRVPVDIADGFWASALATAVLVFIGGWWWLQSPAQTAARDFEECAEQAESATPAERTALMTNCGARFAGRRKPGGGYSYYDFMQNRSFDIAGPNPTVDERKQIDREYMKYLDTVRLDVLSSELAQQQNNIPVADLGNISPAADQPIVRTPKKEQAAKSAPHQPKNASAPCPDGSLTCSWDKLTSAVRNAFGSTLKPE